MQHLTQLTRLFCCSLGALTQLGAVFPATRLRQLGWVELHRTGLLQVDLHQLLALLPQLESWHISSSSKEGPEEGTMQVRFRGRM